MRVIKKINNNVAICIDRNGQELVAFGKGIGFKPLPYDITDLNQIDRTYYGIDPNYLGLLKIIPESVFQLSAKIVDYAKNKISYNISPNVIFTLADHLNFAIERQKKAIKLKYPLQSGIERMYPTEVEIGEKAIEIIKNDMSIKLPRGEASSIAMHFVNAQTTGSKVNQNSDGEEVIDQIVQIIEKCLNIEINQDDFNYLRFVTHMKTLLNKKGDVSEALNEYKKIYASMINEFPEISRCVNEIEGYVQERFNWKLNEEELLYLILHVNRLYSREGCNQVGITSTTDNIE